MIEVSRARCSSLAHERVFAMRMSRRMRVRENKRETTQISKLFNL